MILKSFDYFRNVKRTFSSIFGILLLVILLLFKISVSFHAYTHQDDSTDIIENCTICDVAIENQQTEFIATAPQSAVTLLINVITKERTTVNAHVPHSSELVFSCFGRPPPSLV